MLYPGNIRIVGIISPAGKLAPELQESGISLLRREGLKVRQTENLPECGVSYLAGSPEARAQQLESIWLDPEVDMILCTRGGFGCAQILPLISWRKLARKKICLAGYSDITALHWAMDAKNIGIPAVSPMLGKLSGADAVTLQSVTRAFSGEEQHWEISPVSGGDFSGRILAGNLTVAASLAGTDFFPDSAGRTVLLEDINEPVYKIDRSLTQLEQNGFFDQVSGVVFGSFSGSDPGELQELFSRFAKRIGKPVVSGFPFGHTFPLISFTFRDHFSVSGKHALIFREK